MSGGKPPDQRLQRFLSDVRMPLLRDERAALLRKIWTRWTIVLVGAVFLVGSLIFVFASSGSSKERKTQSPLKVAATEHDQKRLGASAAKDERNKETWADQVVTFGRAKGFQNSLLNAGISLETAEDLVDKFQGILDFRNCKPEDEMLLRRDQSGKLVRFEYRVSVTEVYEAHHDEGMWHAKRKEIPIKSVRLDRGGYVYRSLGKALESVGLRSSLVGRFVQTFQGHINFNTETRQGDRFRIVVNEEQVGGDFLRYGTAYAIEYVGQRVGTRRAFWFEPKEDEGEYFDETGRAMHGGWLKVPLHYDFVSSGFTKRRFHPVLKRHVPHLGVDFVAATGTAVQAAADGLVTFAGDKGANGNLIVISHSNGFSSAYAHLHRINKGIRRGVRVRQGQLIGAVGNTGRSTGPHLHFGLKRRGRPVDPMEELNAPGRMLPARARQRFMKEKRRWEKALAKIPFTRGAEIR